MRNEIDFAKSAKQLYEFFPEVRSEFDRMTQVIHLNREFTPHSTEGEVKRKTRLQIFSECFFEPKTITQIARATDMPRQKVRQRIEAINRHGNLITELPDHVKPKFFVVNSSKRKVFNNPYARVCFLSYNENLDEDLGWIESDKFLNDYYGIFTFKEHCDVKKLKKDFFKIISNPKAFYIFLGDWELGTERFHDNLSRMPNFEKDPFEYLESFKFETIQKERDKKRYVCGLLNYFYSQQKISGSTAEWKEMLSRLAAGLKRRGYKPRKQWA
jgi:hypothetical protein